MKKYYIVSLIAAVLVSCTDKFQEYNLDRKLPSRVPGESLFSNGLKDLSDQVSGTNVNLNVFKLYAQYWNETTYVEETNYDLINRTIPDNMFEIYYVDILQDFYEAKKAIVRDHDSLTAEGTGIMQNKLAITEILISYAYQQLVDIFGDVPYTEAIDIENLSPAYDDAATIYADLIRRVQAAIGTLNEEFESFGDADFIYGGDVAAWKKFGNSLLIKMGITIADVDAGTAQSLIETAVPGAFVSAGDNALFPYQSASPNYNPLYNELVATGRTDYIPANTIVDIMNERNDPRRFIYFTPFEDDTTFIGGEYGTLTPYSQFSHIGDVIHEPTFPGILLSYDELLFYLAEAASRNFNVGSTAEALYTEAITESFAFWGIIEDSLINSYLSNPKVAWATAEGDWKQKIGIQEWLAFYTRGLEGYTTWRRLDYPVLNIAPTLGGNYDLIPTRFTYPVNEQTLNRESWQAASANIEGGDELTGHIFWDTNEITP